MTSRQIQRATVSIVILLACACAKAKQGAGAAVDTSQATHAPATTPPPIAQPAAPPRLPDPPLTSEPQSSEAAAQAIPRVPALENGNAFSHCVEKSRVVSDGFKTPWGATPRDILSTALGAHRTALTWKPESTLSYGAEGTSTTLLVEITRKGPATFMKREGGAQGGQLMAIECASELLIPVHIKAETQDGVLAVEDDAQLVASSRRYIATSLGQMFATHRGTLRVREIREAGMVVPGFGINLGFTRKRIMVGAIRGSYEVTNAGKGIFVEYTCFPATPPPELRGADESEIGCRG
jgi:hypothetical protein